MMPVKGTLCFIEHNHKFLMLKKAEGHFGGGKWNAPGGKLKQNETPKECAVREVFEETGLKVKNLRLHGTLRFFNGGSLDWVVSVFSTSSFEGMMRASDEGELKWIEKESLPFDSMWQDDRHWLPFLSREKNFEGSFYFDKDFQMLLSWSVKEVIK